MRALIVICLVASVILNIFLAITCVNCNNLGEKKIASINGINFESVKLFTTIIDDRFYNWGGIIHDPELLTQVSELYKIRRSAISNTMAKLASMMYDVCNDSKLTSKRLSFYYDSPLEIVSIDNNNIGIKYCGVKASAPRHLDISDCMEISQYADYPDFLENDLRPGLLEATALGEQLQFRYYSEIFKNKNFTVDVNKLLLDPITTNSNQLLREIHAEPTNNEHIFIPLARRYITHQIFIDMLVLRVAESTN